VATAHDTGVDAPGSRTAALRYAVSSVLLAIVFIFGVLLPPVPAAASGELAALAQSSLNKGHRPGIAIAVKEQVAAGKSEPEPSWTRSRIIFIGGMLFAVLAAGFMILHYLRMIGLNSELKASTKKRKRAEDTALRFGHIIDRSLNEIYIFDAQTLKFIQVNHGACVNLGYTMEVLQDLTPVDIKPEFTDETFGDTICSLRDGDDEILVFQTVHERKDGSRYDVELHLQLMKEERSPIFVAIGQDITERKRAEKSLRNAHDQMEQRIVERTQSLTEEIQERRTIEAELLDRTELLQLLNALTTIANEADDTDAAMTACLKEICEYTSWPVGHIYAVSKSDPNVFVPTNIWYMENPEWFSAFHDITMKTEFEKSIGLPGRVMASGKPEWIENVTKDPGFIRDHAGVDIIVRAGFGFPIKVRNKVVAMMEFFSPFEQKTDQTLIQFINQIGQQFGHLYERAESERTLLEAKEKADSANQAKSVFLASMSHELRTPLNAIIGFSQMLQFTPKDPLSEKQTDYVTHITESGYHLLKLINEVLDLAKIEAGKVELSLEEVDAGDACKKCLNLVRGIADERNIKVAVTNPANRVSRVWADATSLNQVLLNLLSNAIKYNRRDGTVKVELANTADGMVRFSVIDTGHGVPEGRMNELFEPFSRLGAEASNVEGTGIGLTVTRELVELMEGQIGFESEVGRGSTFWFELPQVMVLPLPEDAPDAGPESNSSSALHDLQRHNSISGNILYIEDNPINISLMEAIIGEFTGAALTTAENGETGVKMARSKNPDLILLDIKMPDMNGFEALKRLRRSKKSKDIPVVAVTAAAMTKDLEKGLKAGFRDYLTKPFEAHRVLDVIYGALNGNGPSGRNKRFKPD